MLDTNATEACFLFVVVVRFSTMNEFNDYLDDEEAAATNCERCGRDYDEIDYEYQSCSKCGWDAEKQELTKKREPSDADYLNGDADILTGQWY